MPVDPVAELGPAGAESPLVRANLREQVKDVILQRIVSGAYEPGVRLVETRIAHELGVSQAPVREALRDLEQLGCVVHEPFRGCSVRAFSARELLEAFPVRAALEALGARLAAERITDAELGELRALVGSMESAAESGDAHEQSRLDTEFHATIVRAARNATLERQWAFMEPFSRTYISVSRPGLDLHELTDRHRPILAALESRDGDLAEAVMHTHLIEAADLLRPLVQPDKEQV
jgi:DNA-binding GntR family transcriptional regulator